MNLGLAALAYGIGLDRAQREKIAVYDLGGGSFDISILQIEDAWFGFYNRHTSLL